MSSRLHSKYHRHNHHTISLNDPRYPDASYDPIASPDSPFLGDFVLLGTLSASPLSATSQPQTVIAANGNITATGTIRAATFSLTNANIQTFSTPVTATGQFLVLSINGQFKAIRLWNIP
jgi:hypothetical protein